MKKKFCFIIAVLIIVILFFIGFYPTKNKTKQSILPKNYTNLMVVAHPDDEILWGGSELILNDYLVVCITCNTNKKRQQEFEYVMTQTNDKFIALGYPDKRFNTRSNWKKEYSKISNDIKKIINQKSWDKIVTHNKDGEYGHIHHQMTYKLVKNNLSKNQQNKLYVFGKYYSKKELKKTNIFKTLDKEITEKKKKILYQGYKSQEKTIKKLEHMIPYENIRKD